MSSDPANWGIPGVGWNGGFSGIGSNGLTQGNRINNYELADSFSWVRGGHSLKFGAEVRQSRVFLDSDNGPRGTFHIRSELDRRDRSGHRQPYHRLGQLDRGFSARLSHQYERRGRHLADAFSVLHKQFLRPGRLESHPLPEYQLWIALRVRKPARCARAESRVRLQSLHGQQLFPILGQIRDSIVQPDRTNFAPRLGLAYNPTWAPSWTVRAGAGIYFDQTQMNETQFTTNSPPTFFQQNYNLTGAGVPLYQLGVNTLPVTPVPPITPAYQTPKGTNLFAIETNGKKPREYMWNFSLQKSFGSNWLVEGAYVGAQSRRLSKRYNLDAPVVPGNYYNVIPTVDPYPNLNGILYSSQAGKGNFNAMNLKLERRFASGFSLLASYSWSHSIDTDSGGSFGSPNLNPANFQVDKGSSDFDIRQRFVGSLIYELPFGKGKPFLSSTSSWVNQLVGGWQLNFIPTFQSGVNRSVTSPNLSTIALYDAARRCYRDRFRLVVHSEWRSD